MHGQWTWCHLLRVQYDHWSLLIAGVQNITCSKQSLWTWSVHQITWIHEPGGCMKTILEVILFANSPSLSENAVFFGVVLWGQLVNFPSTGAQNCYGQTHYLGVADAWVAKHLMVFDERKWLEFGKCSTSLPFFFLPKNSLAFCQYSLIRRVSLSECLDSYISNVICSYRLVVDTSPHHDFVMVWGFTTRCSPSRRSHATKVQRVQVMLVCQYVLLLSLSTSSVANVFHVHMKVRDKTAQFDS